jgi:membrane associated rhomboid family serine protease
VLGEGGIPYRCGLLAAGAPQVVFSVPREHLAAAQRLLADSDEVELDPASGILPGGGPGFPWRPVLTAAALVAFHLALVGWMVATGSLRRWLDAGALIKGLAWKEPWRLVSSLFLHLDAGHALPLRVFAVPLLGVLGVLRTSLIYFTAGIGGAVTALAFSGPGGSVAGSSGAVAGLFGAWIVLTLSYARASAFTWRARVRTMGIAFLFLPSLVTPMTASGRPVSVASHLGGLATGLAIGALISRRLLDRGGWAQWDVPAEPGWPPPQA